MWNDVLNKTKQDSLFRKDRAILMGILDKYDNNVEYRRTHPGILPNEDKENLDHVGALEKPTPSSRIVLSEVRNPKIFKES